MAHNKLPSLSAYDTLHEHYVICISKTYPGKSIDNDVLSIN